MESNKNDHKDVSIRLISEDTLLVEFGDQFCEEIQKKVFALVNAIANSSLSNKVETLPAIRSVMIRFDPFVLQSEQLIEDIKALQIVPAKLISKQWLVSVCFEGKHAEDLNALSERLHLSRKQTKEKFLNTILRVSMIGFAPGFTYLSGIDEGLHVPRRATPRSPMPENSLMLGGKMASLTSVSMTTGWYVVGQVPFALFDVTRTKRTTFAVGDEIKINAISKKEYANYWTLNQKSNQTLCGLERIQDHDV